MDVTLVDKGQKKSGSVIKLARGRIPLAGASERGSFIAIMARVYGLDLDLRTMSK